MHRHDEDLIMALADGALRGPAADEARAEIEDCAQCRRDLEAQRTAVEWLRGAGPATMTELEIARLRRNLDTALDHGRTQDAQPEPVQSRWARVPWAPLVGVAAVLVGVVLVAPNLDLLGGADDAGDVAADFATATTTASLQDMLNEARVQANDGDSADAPAAAQEEMATEAAGAAEPAAGTTAAPEIAADDGAAFVPGEDQLDEILSRVEEYEADLELLGTSLEADALYQYRLFADEPDCLDESKELFPDAEQSEPIGFIELEDYGETLVIVHFDENDDVIAVVAHDIFSCESVSLVTPDP